MVPGRVAADPEQDPPLGAEADAAPGVCYRTAWRLKHALMQVMAEREAVRRLGGRVRIDDAYLGRTQRRQGRTGLGKQAPFCDRRVHQ